jgi:hypothetical protein
MVIFEVDETAPEDVTKAAFDRAGELLSAIPGVKNMVGGPNINPNATKRSHGVTMEFDSMETMRAYVAHENHAKALTIIRPYNKAATNVIIEV